MKHVDITVLKAQAVEYWQSQAVESRLAIADWEGKLGTIYHGVVRIYVKPDGTLSANKPNGRV